MRSRHDLAVILMCDRGLARTHARAHAHAGARAGAHAPRMPTTHAQHAYAYSSRRVSSCAHLLHKPQRARRATQVELAGAHPVVHPQLVRGRDPQARAQVVVSIPALPRLRSRSGCVASREPQAPWRWARGWRLARGTRVARARWPLLGPTVRPIQRPSRVRCGRGSRGRAG